MGLVRKKNQSLLEVSSQIGRRYEILIAKGRKVLEGTFMKWAGDT